MTNPEPPAGEFDGKTFVFPVRVYYEDTDFSGVVYHASYLRFMERGRSEFLRAIGLPHQELLKAAEPLVWVVRSITIRYRRPARAEDGLEVRTDFVALDGLRFRLSQRIRRGDEVLTEADVEVCLVTLEGRPRRPPDDVAAKMSTFLHGSRIP